MTRPFRLPTVLLAFFAAAAVVFAVAAAPVAASQIPARATVVGAIDHAARPGSVTNSSDLWVSNWNVATTFHGTGISPDVWTPGPGNTCLDPTPANPEIGASAPQVVCVRIHLSGTGVIQPVQLGDATLDVGYRPCCIAGQEQEFSDLASPVNHLDSCQGVTTSAAVPVPPFELPQSAEVVSIPWCLPSGYVGGADWGGLPNKDYTSFDVQVIINAPPNNDGWPGNSQQPTKYEASSTQTFPTPMAGNNYTWGWPFPNNSGDENLSPEHPFPSSYSTGLPDPQYPGNGWKPFNYTGASGDYPEWWRAHTSWVEANFDDVATCTDCRLLKGIINRFVLQNPFNRTVKARFVANLPKGVSVSIKGQPNKGKFGSTFVLKNGQVVVPLLTVTATKKFVLKHPGAQGKPIYGTVFVNINGAESGGITYRLGGK
jgi:hypothetical protein